MNLNMIGAIGTTSNHNPKKKNGFKLVLDSHLDCFPLTFNLTLNGNCPHNSLYWSGYNKKYI